ncbi:hypothetical protein [Streptomyces sp. NPDC047009]|uniref:hypothetical protein n=1 Tax=Streptomyces sp. NPDC047009 TaxID=3154496 RepID=UPI0033ED706A
MSVPRTLAGVGVVCALALASVSACTADDTGDGQPARATRSTGPATAVHVTARPSLQEPPKLDGDETLAGQQKVTRGSASFAFGAGKKGEALIVAVSCQGTGKIEVAVRPASASFPLECRPGEVNTIRNEVLVHGVERTGTVSVEAPSAVRWAVTIGRGEPAQVEPAGTQ